MSYAYAILIVLLLIVAILLVVFILVQQGKGAGMGASFGAGASNTLFGSAGSGNFFTKSTWILATLFVIICLALGYVNTHKAKTGSDYDTIVTEKVVPKVDEANKPIIADEPKAVKAAIKESPVAEKEVQVTSSEVTESTTQAEDAKQAIDVKEVVTSEDTADKTVESEVKTEESVKAE